MNFLQSVAHYFMEGAPGRPSTEELCIVVPNKRARIFLRQYFHEYATGTVIMPRLLTVETFLNILSQSSAAQDSERLFILFDAYRNVMRRRGGTSGIREFDKFIFWGDMILSDFDEIDKALADAPALFKNLRDIKDIQADYLSPDQKAIVRQIWGDSRLTATSAVDDFWMHLPPADEAEPEERMSARFLYLWEILGDLYTEYRHLLEADGKASPGMVYRRAAERLKHTHVPDIIGDTRYAFVGFNDITVAETLIFDKLKDAGSALFFWDTAPLALPTNAALSKPLARLQRLAKHFAAPADYEEPLPERTPKVSVVAAPSNVAQAKHTATVLDGWTKNKALNPVNALNTAIIIPDQGLLLPLLLSVPESIGSLNISMGLPFRTTTFASLLHAIVSMQLRSRRLQGIMHYFYEDIASVLSHPHIRAIASAQADKITRQIQEEKLYNVSATMLHDIAPELDYVFAPVHDLTDAEEVAAYMRNLLGTLADEISRAGNADETKVPTFEVKTIGWFVKQIDELTALVQAHGVAMSDSTFLQLVERFFTSRSISAKGTPLKGLQLLGVLETRALDFDNVIVLSMNEGVFPRKQYAHTMIPANLRKGYGLPDFDSLEWTYAYCFYRLIARASNVVLYYDARTDGKGNGERSRYISQLEYLMPDIDLRTFELRTEATASPIRTFEIKKTPKVMDELRQFMPGGKLKLSASALKTYLKCPFSFYLQFVRRMRGSDELVNYLTAADYGNIVHAAIQQLFQDRGEGSLITSGTFDAWLSAESDDEIPAAIAEAVLKAMTEHRFSTIKSKADLNAEGLIAFDAICAIVKADLEAERAKYAAPFTFIANEWKVNTLTEGSAWQIDDLKLNFFMSIDRVDRLDVGHLRFIDFKTGNEETSEKSVDDLFATDGSGAGMFQVLTYCEAYLALHDASADITPFIHPMRSLCKGEPIVDLSIGGHAIQSYKSDIREQFAPRLHELLHRIFDDNGIGFNQCSDKDLKNCEYCQFASLCGRTKPTF